MSSTAIILAVAFGVSVELISLWVRHRLRSGLTTRQLVLFWVKKLAMVSGVLAAGLLLLVHRTDSEFLMGVLILVLSLWMISGLVLLIDVWSLRFQRLAASSTWSPFQSPEVREICAHLTPVEHARLNENAQESWRQIGLWLVLPVVAMAGLAYWSRQLGLAVSVPFLFYFVFWVVPRIRAIRRRSTEFLCGTEWARARGYTADRLRLEAFPWSE